MTAHYYRNVHAVVFVYDVTKPKSFQNLDHWIKECLQNNISFKAVPAIIIGNKCDCTEQIFVKVRCAFAKVHLLLRKRYI